MQTTTPGEIEAARSLGMSPWLVVRRIVLPSALRRSRMAAGSTGRRAWHLMMARRRHITCQAKASFSSADMTYPPGDAGPNFWT